MNDNIPSPGSAEAQAAGCICEPRDFEAGGDPAYPGWLTEGCPIHGVDDE